ncbi:hypothetical protein ABFX02_13G018100 [Erythranthe guttata]
MSDADEAETSGADEEVRFTLKAVINRHKTKVLFAEIDSRFADVLLSFLTMPLGKIVKLLNDHYRDEAPPIGSLTSLYDGLSNLDSCHFWTEGCKNMLLNPRSSLEYKCSRLKLDINDTRFNNYFCCEDPRCSRPSYSNISMHRDVGLCACGRSLNREVGVRNSCELADGDRDDGVFVVANESFLISDDLRLVPNVAGSVMGTLKNLGITDMDGAELRNVVFGFDEVIDLLKGSLLSRTPLSDMIILNRRKFYIARPKPERGIHEREFEGSSSIKKTILKVTVQKSTNKLLFAQSNNEFVDFLCSLLTFPLGGVEYHLCNNTSFKGIDNLYTSLADFIGDEYLANADIRKSLMKPSLPHGYMSENKILPLVGNTDPRLFYHKGLGMDEEWLSYSSRDSKCARAIKYRNNGGYYINGRKMYMVSDDLTVTPLCMISIFSILKDMKITLSDVKEVEVPIGVDEGLSILKASLTSTTALTDGLMLNPVLNKKPKQEPQGYFMHY